MIVINKNEWLHINDNNIDPFMPFVQTQQTLSQLNNIQYKYNKEMQAFIDCINHIKVNNKNQDVTFIGSPDAIETLKKLGINNSKVLNVPSTCCSFDTSVVYVVPTELKPIKYVFGERYEVM